MKIVNGYEIKPGADLWYADLEGAYLQRANLEGANLTGTILEKKNEVPQDDKDLKIKELEDKLNALKALLDA